jgi:hypothetical protein
MKPQATATIVPGGGMPPAARTDRTVATPPENIRQRFETTYPGSVSVAWKIEGDNFKVNYTDPKTKLEHVIVYDKDGNVVRREDETDNLTYPSDIAEFYTKKYPKETFRVWQTELEPGVISYFIVRKGKTLWFDQTGKPTEGKKKD